MKGDFSRNTFKSANHYRGVRWQQGRPVTDADQNEAQDIAAYRVETETTDVVGQSGGPKGAAGFALSANAGDLLIGAGRYYVDGLLVENDATDSTYANQPFFPNPDAIPNLIGAGMGLVYLDVFERQLTYQDREEMRDPALNGVDTTTRTQLVWKVRVLPLPSLNIPAATMTNLNQQAAAIAALKTQIAGATGAAKEALIRQRNEAQRKLDLALEEVGITCQGNFAEWNTLVAPPTGRLTLPPVDPPDSDDPCDVPYGGGYTRGENQYYRIQVHTTAANGQRNGTTFKWSRDNGSIVARITAVGQNTTGTHTATVFNVDSTQRDDYLGFHIGDWVEYQDDILELNSQPGALAKVSAVDSNLNRITVDRSLTVNLSQKARLRKWDQVGDTFASGVPMNTTNNGVVALEGGIQARFSAGAYRSGDFWQFAARAATGKLDFPASAQAPAGIEHHYSRLGFIAMDGQNLRVWTDCRDLFPPLTDITARDVSFDNTSCKLPEARTVQDAIDQLCQRLGGGTCTLAIGPGPDWFRVFDQIDDGMDAEVCLGVGDYPLDRPVSVDRKGKLIITGAGQGTRIIAPDQEIALRFIRCESVTVRDLFAQTGVAGSGGEKLDSLGGTLTFIDCRAVSLERVGLRCAAAVVRSAACVNVTNNPKRVEFREGIGMVDIQDCHLEVGSNQIGAILINTARVTFENNVVRCIDGRGEELRLPQGLRENRELLAEVRRVIFSNLLEGRSNTEDRFNHVINEVILNFRTDDELVRMKFFNQLLEIVPPKAVKDFNSAREYLQDAVDLLILEPDRIPAFRDYILRVFENDLPAMYAGLMIVGEEAGEVRINNNTFIETLQGIHLGLSGMIENGDQKDAAGMVSILGNTVYSRITPTVNREAYGMYIGNNNSLLVDNNVLRRLTLEVTSHMVMNGIHVAGSFGKRLVVSHNDTAAYGIGIAVLPTNQMNQPLWRVVENVARLRIIAPVVESDNVPD